MLRTTFGADRRLRRLLPWIVARFRSRSCWVQRSGWLHTRGRVSNHFKLPLHSMPGLSCSLVVQTESEVDGNPPPRANLGAPSSPPPPPFPPFPRVGPRNMCMCIKPDPDSAARDGVGLWLDWCVTARLLCNCVPPLKRKGCRYSPPLPGPILPLTSISHGCPPLRRGCRVHHASPPPGSELARSLGEV